MKPIALDLACGKGGWTIGLQAAGWEVYGVDVTAWAGYPGKLIQADVRTLKVEDLPKGIKLVTASPPCQEFSYRGFPFKKCKNLPPPDLTIWEACVRIARELGVPIVIENVRNAQKWMGKAQAHYGSFYLWGDLPVLMPFGRPTKGFTRVKDVNNPTDKYVGFGGNSAGSRKMAEEGKSFGWNKAGVQDNRKQDRTGTFASARDRDHSHMVGERQRFAQRFGGDVGSGSSIRKEWSALIAMIPYELAHWIGTYFMEQQ